MMWFSEYTMGPAVHRLIHVGGPVYRRVAVAGRIYSLEWENRWIDTEDTEQGAVYRVTAWDDSDGN